MREFTIKFNPEARSTRVPQGTDIRRAAAKAGIMVSAPCGGEGVCGKCRVIVNKGSSTTEASRFIDEVDKKKGVVLACRTLIESDIEVTIPEESLETHGFARYDTEDLTRGITLEREKLFRFSPLVDKVYLKLPRQSALDDASHVDRIISALKDKFGRLRISMSLMDMGRLGERLRMCDYKITAVLGYKDGVMEVLCLEPGDTTGSNFAFAFDIGTTTVAGQLIDLGSGAVLGARIAFNKQAVYGADVITRIVFASEPDGMEKLNASVIDNINEIIEDLSKAHGVDIRNVYAVVCAGNMTMMHLLLKIDPSGIRKAPYMPAVRSFPAASASRLAIGINPDGLAAFLPGVSTYVGGDIVSGVLACGLVDSEDLTLLADIGTNGEIVLGNRDWMIGSAASAGPAFEGSGLACGMKAVGGAIQKITIDERLDVKFETISHQAPKGICGSGYIDLLCQMLKRKIIGRDGRINRNIRSGRIRSADNNYEFVVAKASETEIGRDIVIQDDDIENLKRSKGAIYSAIIALLIKVGKDIGEIKKIYIAGGFGNYLNIENSIFIGLLPDIERSVYEFIGNSSLSGARMSLLSQEALEKTNDIYRRITYLDLSAEPGYMDEYVASLFFPHTDIGRFPSVRL